jgi:putative ABC transport system permease protein
MSLWKVAWRSIQQRALASGLTAFSMGLGVALVVTVLVVLQVVEQSFSRGAGGYDLIVGGKGFSLQLVLNTVFYLQKPLPNLPYKYYEEFTEGHFKPAVLLAIPLCTGHDVKNCPAVATDSRFFDELRYLDGRKFEFAEGRNIRDENYYEAVLGATAARKTGLKIGDTFQPVAKTGESPNAHGHHDFTVVGILAPTGTPNDRAVFTNIEGFWRCPAHQGSASEGEAFLATGSSENLPDKKTSDNQLKSPSPPAPLPKGEGGLKHAAHEDDHDHEIHKALSAILIRTDKSKPFLAFDLKNVINKGSEAQAVEPTREISEFLAGIIGNIRLLLLVLAVLVVVVAGIGIMVSIYNSMSDRKHEIAIMRALGARRSTVMLIILFESILLALGGGALGVGLGHGLIAYLSPTIVEQIGVVVSPWDFQTVELILIPGLIVLATLVGYLPAMYAYKTDVAKSLMAGA